MESELLVAYSRSMRLIAAGSSDKPGNVDREVEVDIYLFASQDCW